MSEQLTIGEALKVYEHNPDAAALAVGMVLMQNSRDDVDRITKSIDDANQKRIDELEQELAYWKPLGKKWLSLKNLLSDEIKVWA